MNAFVFPGQGSQSVGMGRAFYESHACARHVFQEVDDALHQKLSKIIFEGDEADLSLTSNTQPALMAVSVATLRVLEHEAGKPLMEQGATCVAGHSLGEYSALVAAGALSLTQAAQLLRIRGDAMQKAVPVGQGAMAALLGATLDEVEALVQEGRGSQVCEIANDNAPGQVVISGALEAVERVLTLAKEKGVKRAVRLPVSAPFHCALMQPAADTMRGALEVISFAALQIPLIANMSAQTIATHEICDSLVAQVTGRVRWNESMAGLKDRGVRRVVELGAGKVLSGLMKRIDPDLEAMSLNTTQDIDLYLEKK